MSDVPRIEFHRLGGFQSLLRKYDAGERNFQLGLPRSVRLPFLAAISSERQAVTLLITSRSEQIASMIDELHFWTEDQDVMGFSEPPVLFYERSHWTDQVRADRISVLTNLTKGWLPGNEHTKPFIIMTSVKALMMRTLPRRDFLKACLILNCNAPINLLLARRRLAALGYETSDIVVKRGQVSHRGGILDIWSPSEPYPARCDFFGDELEYIKQFDPSSQRSIKNLDTLFVPPAREVLAERDEVNQADPPEEFELPLLSTFPASLLDYLPKNAQILFDNLASLEATADQIETQSTKTRHELIKVSAIPADFPLPYLTWSELMDNATRFVQMDLGHPLESADKELANAFTPADRFGGRVEEFLDAVHRQSNLGNTIQIISKQKNRLEDLYIGNSASGGIVHFHEGMLSSGWKVIYSDGAVEYVFTDSEIFGWDKNPSRGRSRERVENPEASFADLKAEMWVVHIDYGIGKFKGLIKRSLEGAEREYLLIEYADKDQLFVPIHQADRVTPYIGPDDRVPHPTRLGGTEWLTSKSRVSAAVQEIARELLELYALRQTIEGFAFQPDNEWQVELETGFPYTETEDQAQAIKEVKQDMEDCKPMDRLLCGDVGYGKTEVALRAAFKAVMSGKQVGMLVPTTVLAQQHFDTFRNRLAPFPVTVEMLSRFRTSTEQHQVINALSEGKVDIVIGTHRLIQNDVKFDRLGLLIIDEEQRFGVTHKEFFKKFRTEIDVLTLTATPIPRTLYMALSGVRDISVINTPPSDRQPVQTFIGGYDPQTVRRAIMREIDRGGQVFFVHNRVQTIYAMGMHLTQLIPEARIGIAHGQMPEEELSTVMRAFTNHEIDVLLSTSIIESGLDIPNANTLIVDRADTFGLAQLYQLRGRVGRAAVKAFAYFFYHKKKKPTPEGLERLEVIAENTQLGAGYSIAMRDLEMRGAGDLLGTMQSGNIAAVGFQLFTRLLNQAVNEQKRTDGIKLASGDERLLRGIRRLITIELPFDASIPSDYVSDAALRLRLYRRIAEIENVDALISLRDEFADRFGSVPTPVENLFYQLSIKLKAESIGLSSITTEGDQIVLRYPAADDGVPRMVLPDIGPAARAGKNAYWISTRNVEDWRTELNKVLEKIAELEG